jgi:aspartyl-tRNA(Asn)/glutamyl-tRNA(Gln) amidotransferase subunit A
LVRAADLFEAAACYRLPASVNIPIIWKTLLQQQQKCTARPASSPSAEIDPASLHHGRREVQIGGMAREHDMTGPTLSELARLLASGKTTAAALVEACLAEIERAGDNGGSAFIAVAAENALAAARAQDGLRAAGAAPSPLAGIPISVKDLFDLAGERTRAGSAVLDDAPPASADAPAIARLRQAGLVVIGRSNMTEFAYSGLGLNPHYGTPASVWSEGGPRAPGGSSSGAAISVARGMAHAGIGTDTGGSCRIPAAFNGLAGFKPTARRVPTEGAIPLSTTLDSVGPLARTARCCALLDGILSGEGLREPAPMALTGLRLAVPTTIVLDDLDRPVAEAFEAALGRLSRAGALVTRMAVPEFAEIGPLNAKGGLSAAESLAWHRPLVAKAKDRYDPRVLARILRGKEQDAADYVDLVAGRRALIARISARLAGFDALVMPTTAIVPPRIADLAGDEAYNRANMLALRNPSFINMIDGCAASIPASEPGAAPVGLTVAGLAGSDSRILSIAAAAEAVVVPG